MLVTGVIKNLIHGVSTQNPRERVEGQVQTMRNVIPDPTEGAVRRPGVKYIQAVVSDLPAEEGAEVIWRDLPLESGDFSIGTYRGRIILRDMATGLDIPVRQEPLTYDYFEGGIVATANIGEYTLLAGDVIPEVTQLQKQALFPQAYRDNSASTLVSVNRVVVFEIRQGAYSGVYTIRRTDGSALASYTVPDGSVGNHSVNVQPNFIATQLYSQLLGAIGGAVGPNTIRAVQQQGASVAIFLEAPTPDQAIALYADDGFYNTRFRMTDRFTDSSNVLPGVGIEGHVVEVGSTSNSSGNYFLRFEHTQSANEDGVVSLSSNLLRPGSWVETGRSYINTGYADGGKLTESTMPSLLYIYEGIAYVGTGQWIATAIQGETGFVIEALSWNSRAAGDSSSSPDPYVVGTKIVWMGIFQDRLVLMGTNAVSISRTGDYLNFYRASVLDDLATDPINLPATFDPNDVLVGAAMLDKSLVVIGTKTHYAIAGRTALTPSNANLLATSSFESSPTVHPVAFGNQVYFSSASAQNSDILAIQPAETTDSTYAYSVSSHVDGYIPGDLVAMKASTKVNILFALNARGSLYCYRTLFNQGDRVLSSWFDFEFPTDLKLKTIMLRNTRIRMLFSRIDGDKLNTVVGELDLDRIGFTGANGHRYLDFWTDNYTDTLYKDVVLSSTQGRYIDRETNLYHSNTDEVVEFDADVDYMLGVPFAYLFEPTMPLPRDQEDRVIGIGKLVVTLMQINYTIASDFTIRFKDKFRDFSIEHSARPVDAPDSFTDEAYITDGKVSFPIGSSEASGMVSIFSDNHYPLVMSSIDWKGQYFKRGMQM